MANLCDGKDYIYNLYQFANYCIDSYYFKQGYIYYHKVYNDRWSRTIRKTYPLKYGYKYDCNSKVCLPDSPLSGVDGAHYAFLMGLSGVLFGSIMFYIVLRAIRR